MTTRIALALGLLVSLQPLACSDDDACDYDFPMGLEGAALQREICDFVAEVDACVRENEDVDALDDDALRASIDSCSNTINVCSDDPTTETLLLPGSAFDEIRGNTNDCVG